MTFCASKAARLAAARAIVLVEDPLQDVDPVGAGLIAGMVTEIGGHRGVVLVFMFVLVDGAVVMSMESAHNCSPRDRFSSAGLRGSGRCCEMYCGDQEFLTFTHLHRR